MNLGSMRTRILIGVGAWLLGAATATGGSMLAVSRLGHGIAAPPGRQLTMAKVDRELASASATAPAAGPSVKLGGSSTPLNVSPQPTPSPRPTSAGTVLTSQGGTVVAGCATAGAYLVSWSPQQGYQTDWVARGPAASARVVFKSEKRKVTMNVTCSAGTPSATVEVRAIRGGDD